MTTENATQTETTPSASAATAAPATTTSGPSVLGISAGTIVTSLVSLLTAAAGASPWGVGAIAALGLVATLAGTYGYNYLINKWNAKTDADDQNAAGADAGHTAVDLANQGTQVNSNLDNMQGANPPISPTKK